MVEFNLRIKRCEGLESKWNKTWVYVVVFFGEKRLWNSSNSCVTKGKAEWPETGPDCPSYIFDTTELQTASGFSLGKRVISFFLTFSGGSKKFVLSLKLLTLEGKTLLTVAKWKIDVMPFQTKIDPVTTTIKKKGSPTLFVCFVTCWIFWQFHRSLSLMSAHLSPCRQGQHRLLHQTKKGGNQSEGWALKASLVATQLRTMLLLQSLQLLVATKLRGMMLLGFILRQTSTTLRRNVKSDLHRYQYVFFDWQQLI